MGNFEIRVLATDGIFTKEAIHINIGKHISYSFIDQFGSGNNHFTYHNDGYVHKKSDFPDGEVEKKPLVQGPPLDNFAGFYGVSGFIIAADSLRIPFNPFYDRSEYDATVYIDIRGSEDGIEVRPYFVEPGMPVTEILEHPGTQGNDHNLCYQVITETDPWIVIFYYNIDEFGGYLARMSEDFVSLTEDGKPHPEDPHGKEKFEEYRS